MIVRVQRFCARSLLLRTAFVWSACACVNVLTRSRVVIGAGTSARERAILPAFSESWQYEKKSTLNRAKEERQLRAEHLLRSKYAFDFRF